MSFSEAVMLIGNIKIKTLSIFMKVLIVNDELDNHFIF